VISKTEAIVLKTLKYQDAGLITTLYTELSGIKSFIIKGFRSTRARNRHSYFQPLSLIEIIYQDRPTSQLQKIRESKTSILLHEIQTHPVKLSLGLAMVEIFYQCVKEEEANPALYHFFRSCIILIDQSEQRLIQIFIYFLIHLTKYLGFFPNDISQDAPHVFFDETEGTITPVQDGYDHASRLIRGFMESNLETCQQLAFDQVLKRQLIQKIFKYYTIHIDGFQYPKTLKVFTEVFG